MATSIEANASLKGYYTQFLDDEEYLFTSEYGSWSATGASLAVEKNFRFRSAYNTLKVTPTSALTPPATSTLVELTHEAKTVGNQYNTDAMMFSVFVYAPSRCDVEITIEDSFGVSETSATVKIPGQKWTLVRGPQLRVLQQTTSQEFTSTLSLTTYGGTSAIYIAHPALINYYGFTDNDFVRECNVFMPPILAEIDAEQTNPTFPMARLMDVGLAYANNAFQQSLDFRYVDIEDGYDENDDTTKSKLVDPEAAEPDYLPWLAQFVGVSFDRGAGGTTPWKNLPTTWDQILLDIDPTSDVAYTISSISRDGSAVVTAVTTTSPSGLAIGNTITIIGTTAFNGQYVLTNVNTGTNTLTWTSSGTVTSESSGTVTLVDEEWIEIEAYDTSDANFIPGRRDLISTARTGINAGTKQAIIDALSSILAGTKTVSYTVDIATDPWLISLETLTSETIGGVTGVESELVMRAVRKVKPMGFTITHSCVASF